MNGTVFRVAPGGALHVAGRAVTAALGAATPYAVLDLPTFLNSFAAQTSRFAGARVLPEAPWITDLEHLALSATLWLPPAGIGAVFTLWALRQAGSDVVDVPPLPHRPGPPIRVVRLH